MQNAIDEVKAWPLWAQFLAGLIVVGLVVSATAAALGPDPESAERQEPRASYGPLIDGTTVYNSAAAAFINSYRTVVDERARVGGRQDSCTSENGVDFRCSLPVEFPVLEDPRWVYKVRVDRRTGCWTATASPPFGEFQHSVDAYRNRAALAPPKAEVVEMVRSARKLRRLRGCIPKSTGQFVGRAPTQFLAQQAAANVERRIGGAAASWSCKFEGVDTLGPDSHRYRCLVRLRTGKAYVDRLYCFSKPPYESYGNCGEEEGYPKRPPRRLPA